MRVLWFLLIGALWAGSGGAAAAPGNEAEKAAAPAVQDFRLAAFDVAINAPGISPKLGAVLAEVLFSAVAEDGRFREVITGPDLRAMVDLDAQKNILGCTESSCFNELGAALDVPYLLVAELGRVGQKHVFNLKVLEVAAARVRVRQSGMVDNPSELPKLVGELAERAMDEFFAQAAPQTVAGEQAELEAMPGIAVIDLEAVHGVKPSMAAVLSDIMLSRLTEAKKFRSVVAGEDLRDMLS
jgi:hypothetical protein